LQEFAVQIRFRSILAAVAAFVAVGVSAAPAGFPGAGISFPAITKVEEKLNLTPVQKAQFDVALAATRAAFVSIEASHLELKVIAEKELAKTRPDLELLTAELDDAMDLNRIERQKARAEWLKLYPMLSDEQVAIVKAAMQEKVALLSWIREFVVKWFVVKRG
jgi:hypothetical protein